MTEKLDVGGAAWRSFDAMVRNAPALFALAALYVVLSRTLGRLAVGADPWLLVPLPRRGSDLFPALGLKQSADFMFQFAINAAAVWIVYRNLDAAHHRDGARDRTRTIGRIALVSLLFGALSVVGYVLDDAIIARPQASLMLLLVLCVFAWLIALV